VFVNEGLSWVVQGARLLRVMKASWIVEVFVGVGVGLAVLVGCSHAVLNDGTA